jgi:hypothetical protein
MSGDVIPVPFDLEGFFAKMQIRESANKVIPIYTLTSDPGGGIVINGAEGELELYIPATATRNFRFETATYDLELTPPSGENDTFKLLRGTITLIPEVTR